MTLVGLAVVGIILGAAGMQFLRSSKPEMVEKAEDGLKRFVNSIRLSQQNYKKAIEN